MDLKPAELLALEACAVNTRMKEREAAHRVEMRRDRELRALLLLRASRAGATYDDLAAICEGMTERTVSNEIAEARKHTSDPELSQRLPRLRSGTFVCAGECGHAHEPRTFTSAQGLAMHRNRLDGKVVQLPPPPPIECPACGLMARPKRSGGLRIHGPKDARCNGAPVEAEVAS